MRLSNDYAKLLGADNIPKAVLAAVALSLALRLADDDLNQGILLVYDEWDYLNANGIVPQRSAPAPKQ